VRGHHGGGLVNRIEHWYYTHHQPKVGGTVASLPAVTSSGAGRTVPSRRDGAPLQIAPLVADPLPGEGTWHPTGTPVSGVAPIEVAYMRPDAIHTSVVVALAWVDHRVTQVRLVPGRTLPGHGPWPDGYGVPIGLQQRLLAAFNSGFRMQDSRGGFYLGGRTVGGLQDGAASLVVHADGTATVEAWGRDERLSSAVVAVRQNLALIVDAGRLADGIDDNYDDRWGMTLGNGLFVWRSGVGVDAHGNLIYAAGNGLSVHSLAELLRRAGAVRAMELDINRAWVSFNVFPHDANGQLVADWATKLLAGMKKPATRYLTPDDRDFVAILARA
jgi:hypothetical protein